MMQVFFQMEACGDFDVNNRATYFKDNNFKAQKDTAMSFTLWSATRKKK